MSVCPGRRSRCRLAGPAESGARRKVEPHGIPARSARARLLFEPRLTSGSRGPQEVAEPHVAATPEGVDAAQRRRRDAGRGGALRFGGSARSRSTPARRARNCGAIEAIAPRAASSLASRASTSPARSFCPRSSTRTFIPAYYAVSEALLARGVAGCRGLGGPSSSAFGRRGRR